MFRFEDSDSKSVLLSAPVWRLMAYFKFTFLSYYTALLIQKETCTSFWKSTNTDGFSWSLGRRKVPYCIRKPRTNRSSHLDSSERSPRNTYHREGQTWSHSCDRSQRRHGLRRMVAWLVWFRSRLRQHQSRRCLGGRHWSLWELRCIFIGSRSDSRYVYSCSVAGVGKKFTN